MLHLPYIEMLSQVDIILQRTDFLPLVLILHLQVCISTKCDFCSRLGHVEAKCFLKESS
jgi:hypothetical protein